MQQIFPLIQRHQRFREIYRTSQCPRGFSQGGGGRTDHRGGARLVRFLLGGEKRVVAGPELGVCEQGTKVSVSARADGGTACSVVRLAGHG